MNRTVFKISKMDCPSEENIIRMKLSGEKNIHSLEFDLQGRILAVYHSNNYNNIYNILESLNFDTSFVSSEISDRDIFNADTVQEKKLLKQVLFINLFFFVLELGAGFLANSMGLLGDSLDMLADSIVYGLAIYAVGGTELRKKKIAGMSAYFQMFLALLGLGEVIRRFIEPEPLPGFLAMIFISVLALIGNALCLYLLQKSRSTEAHMQASMIFTSNDVIVNIGVICAGGLVYLTDSKYPDLLVGIIVFLLVGQGAFRILKLSK